MFLKIFEKDPEKRMRIYDIIHDPWVTRDGDSEVELDLESLTSKDSVAGFGSVGKVEVDDINRDIRNGNKFNFALLPVDVELQSESETGKH